MQRNLLAPSPSSAPFAKRPRFSPLVLADQLLTLAQEADRAGLHDSASRLIGLVYSVLDEEPGARV